MEEQEGRKLEKWEKTVRALWIARIVLWVIAGGATVYWVVMSFRMYDILGTYDVYEYGQAFRPIFYTALLISFACVGVSFILRSISDKIKKANRGY